MEITLQSKTAIVTGGSRGIGRAIALKLGRLGASVAVGYRNQTTAAEAVAAEIVQLGSRAVVIRADLRRVNEIESLFDRTIDRFGAVDILVNNAGIAIFKRIQDFTEEQFDDMMESNVKGLFFACREAARKMANGGHIVNIASSVTKVMMPNYGAYAATKGAVEQITRVLAKELGPRGIAVNCISPGPTDTELFRHGKTDAQIETLASMAAFGRIGTPEDIANAVALMVSEPAGWITGQNLCVNGGFVA